MMNNEYETLLTSLRGLLMDEHDEIPIWQMQLLYYINTYPILAGLDFIYINMMNWYLALFRGKLPACIFQWEKEYVEQQL